jgi:hypothetical protein
MSHGQAKERSEVEKKNLKTYTTDERRYQFHLIIRIILHMKKIGREVRRVEEIVC